MISLSQKEVILGGLLGDSSCSLKKIISFSQCKKQKNYPNNSELCIRIILYTLPNILPGNKILNINLIKTFIDVFVRT